MKRDDRVFTHATYEKLVQQTIDNLVLLGQLKGGEYAGDGDRLANFRRNAEKNDVPYTTVWNIYASKHWDAIQQYILDVKQGKTRQRLETLSGRCDDIIVYMILFKAILIEGDVHADE